MKNIMNYKGGEKVRLKIRFSAGLWFILLFFNILFRFFLSKLEKNGQFVN